MKALIKKDKNQSVSNLKAVRNSFEDWRRARKKHGPLPDELWMSAVSLCGKYSVSKVSQELRLNYSDLLKRVNGNKVSSTRNTPAYTFVDVSNPGIPVSENRESECSMEIRDREGFSMKMHCRGQAGVDILELCRIVMDNR